MKLVAICICFGLSFGFSFSVKLETALLAASIEGVISGGIGFPLIGADVKVLSDDGKQIRRILTDEEGKYEARNLPPGRYTISVEIRGFHRARRDIELKDGERMHLDIWLEVLDIVTPQSTLKLRGVVLRANKTPLPNATVIILNPFNQKRVSEARTNTTGRYNIEIPSGGQFIVYAYKAGFTVRAKSVLVLQEGKTVDFLLSPVRL